jgi:hypothetical protein
MSKEQIEAARSKVIKQYENQRLKAAGGERAKRPLNVYQQFMKDNIAELKRLYPNDSVKQRFKAAVDLWRKHKASQGRA